MVINQYTEKVNIGDSIYRELKKRILDWEWCPGQQLSEQKVAEELGVSRTPVREAFIKLVGEDLLMARPYVGTFVSHIQLSYVEEARFVRENLEKAVAELACGLDLADYLSWARGQLREQEKALADGNLLKFMELDDGMHGRLFEACGKGRAWQLIDAMNAQYNRLRYLSLSCSDDHIRLVQEHKEILQAIEQKDPELSALRAGNHLHRLIDEIDAIRLEYPDYFL